MIKYVMFMLMVLFVAIYFIADCREDDNKNIFIITAFVFGIIFDILCYFGF